MKSANCGANGSTGKPARRKRTILQGAILVLLAIGPVGAGASPFQAENAAPAAESKPKLVIETQGFTSTVNSLDFSPKGDVLAAAGSDKVVRLWDVHEGRLLATLRGYDDDAGNGQCMVVRYSPDGHWLAVGVKDFSESGTIRIYDTADTSEIRALLPGHGNGGTNRLAFSKDGRYLASGGADGEIIFWDWPARRPIGRVARSANIASFGFPTPQPVLVAGGPGFEAFSAPHGREYSSLTPAEQAELGPPETIAETRGLIDSLARIAGNLPHQGQLTAVRDYARGGGLAEDFALFAGSGKKEGRDAYWVGLWATSGRLVRLYEGQATTPTALALAHDGVLAASADVFGNVDVWETASGHRRARFAGKGRPVYGAGFDTSGTKVLFGTEPYGPDRWNYNSYAATSRSFDLHRRLLAASDQPPHDPSAIRRGEREVRMGLDAQRNVYEFTSLRGGRTESQFPLSPGVVPLCFGYLGQTRTGVQDFMIIGANDNTLSGIDPADPFRSRGFLGHTSAVNAFGGSPDGRFLVTGSSDRTLRVWGLGRMEDEGWPDFFAYADGIVYYLKPGGSSERAGVLVGDELVKVGGRDLGTIFDRKLDGHRDYLPGQVTEVEFKRGGQPYRVMLELVPSGDNSIPLLNLYVVGDDWVLWAPNGYFDCSPGADRLIGWHVNRGRARAARFYSAHQFRKQFFRPDVIDKILETADVVRGTELAQREASRAGRPLDLRKPEDFRKVEPPQVTLLAPRRGSRVPGRTIQVRAEVASQNGLPIGEVKILLNGRPAAGKDLPRHPDDTPTKRHVDMEVELDPGTNTLSVLATDRGSKSSSRPQLISVHCDGAVKAEDKPRAFVLAVGISTYALLPKKDFLDFPHLDAAEFAKAWKSQAGSLYGDVQARILTNENANVAAVREGFNWLNESVRRDDVAVIFFAAHGIEHPSKGYYIATHDVDMKRLETTSLPDHELIGNVEGLKCRRAVVFLDTCHAGGILLGGKQGPARTLHEMVSDEVGAVLFGACQPKEKSEEDTEFKHGVFTKVILDTFKDPMHANGLLSIDDMGKSLRRKVPELNEEQHPVVNRPEAVKDFNFFTSSKATKPTALLRTEKPGHPGQ